MNPMPQWTDPFSPEGLRQTTAKVLTGSNYRLFYETVTRRALIEKYGELAELARRHPKDDDAWKAELREMVERGTPEDRGLRYWLIGLTAKTAQNLGLRAADYPSVFDDVMAELEGESWMHGMKHRDMALLLWCGTATLTIRGSRKSRIGKSLERSLARAALTVIGLTEPDDFRVNVAADAEVTRETDAEVRTPRGWVRVEVGLIGRGNSEVISDKVGRMDRNGMILMDILPAHSTAYRTAENRGVKLIQMRHNHPVEELRRHLASLGVGVQGEAITAEEVEERVGAMPASAFDQREKARDEVHQEA